VAENRKGWPPAGTQMPPLLYPTLNIVLLLICGWSMWYGGVVMKKGKNIVFAWLVVLCCAASSLGLYLRWLQFGKFPFAIGDNAYASFVWVLSGFHFLHVTSALAGTAVIGWLAAKGYYTVQRQLGIQIDTMYWYFVVLVWFPIYIVLYILPRLL
ncbi:MAG: heme-copper oxidase subunit III, partial [Candidatus Omnitrophica bacterium]|nr:heme-copper oxidase subunit III [Candidatus Omnitrophota bacterium]